MKSGSLTQWARDGWPAVIFVVVASYAATRLVAELESSFAVLTLAGLVGVLGALSSLPGLSEVASPPMPSSPPSTSPLSVAPAPVDPPIVTQWPGVRTVPSPTEPPSPTQSPLPSGYEVFSIPKDGNQADDNEDAWTVGTTAAVAVCDGASSSFGATVWASVLSRWLAEAEQLTPTSLEQLVGNARLEWISHFESREVPWWAREGLANGAFATLLVVRFVASDGVRMWDAAALGDSCLIQLRHGERWYVVDAFPLSDSSHFGSNPPLLGSRLGALDELQFRRGEVLDGDVLLLATDAVAEWMLGDETRVGLAATATLDHLRRAVIAARTRGEVVNDDLTLIRIKENESA
jgi:serine/threonine protein phosphatase PrpC